MDELGNNEVDVTMENTENLEDERGEKVQSQASSLDNPTKVNSRRTSSKLSSNKYVEENTEKADKQSQRSMESFNKEMDPHQGSKTSIEKDNSINLLKNPTKVNSKSRSSKLSFNKYIEQNTEKADKKSQRSMESFNKEMDPHQGSKSSREKDKDSINLSKNLKTINGSSSKISYSTPIHSTVQIQSESVKNDQCKEETYTIFPRSTPSSFNANPNLIIVRFECEDTSFASAFDKNSKIDEIKDRLCYVLELEKDFVTFFHDNIEIKDAQSLTDLESQYDRKVIIRVLPKNGIEGSALLKEKIQVNIPTSDVITVHLNQGGYTKDKDIVVEIVNESVQKHWLGGYRNKATGTEYHNACTQTKKEKTFFETDEVTGEKIPLVFNRDTQTPFIPVTKTVNTVVDKGTQMSRHDLYITSKNDIIISCNKKRPINSSYTSEYYLSFIILLQKNVRRWLMRKKLIALIETQIEELRKFKESQQKIIHDQEVKDRCVLTGAVYPVNRDDFYALFLRVEKWWKKEWKKICETKSSETKKAASVKLVEEETKLLKAIEKHKAASKAESLKKEDISYLEQISRPVLFRTSKGHLTTIDDLETQKAREFKELYSDLTRKDLLPKVRLEILVSVKRLFETQYKDNEYANDLVSLIDREIELIGMGFKGKDLKGLRSRIEQLFFIFLQQPELIPSAKRYKKPNLPKTLHQTFQCTRCLKLLPASKFPVHVRMRAFTQCKSCTWMQNIAHERADMSPYLKLLHQIQNSEMQKCCYSAICFILQPIGIGHLTNVIWHGHSAISECSDIAKLQHVRWLPDVEWAPWNTILLTDQEAKLHESIPDVFSFYDERFIEKVRRKHILARKRFIPLLMMDHDIRSSGQWSHITDSGVFLHPSHAERISNENSEYDTV